MRNTIHTSLYLLLIGLLFNVQQLYSQQVELSVRFDPPTCTYSVYATPNFTQAGFFVAGGTQITVVVPNSVDNSVLLVNTVNGGPWGDSSQIYQPAASSANDFHAVSSNGSLLDFTANTEIVLFTFQLPNTQCCAAGIRLFENGTDPQSNAPGMAGGDFTNYFADAFNQTDYYIGNYNNAGTICDPCLISPVATPTTADATQDFCLANTPTLADIQINETDIRWYDAATAGNLLPDTTPLADGTIYYAAQFETVNDCESATRLAITVGVDDAPTPTTTDTTQDFCLVNNPTVANLSTVETGVTWYATATGGTAIPAATALTNGIYYGSLTDGLTGCISSVRLAVTVTVNDTATPTTTDTTQDFCLVNNPTVANLSTVESGVTWYATATGGTAIPAATALADGIYYGSLTNGVTGCASSVRLAVTVDVNDAATPTTTDTTQDFCLVNNPTVANLSTVETGVTWYATATGGTAIPAATALADGIYYGSLTNGVTGCASSVRLAVTVDVNDAATPTTTDTTQDFCLINNPTVANLSTVESGVTWYATATGGTAIPAATALVNGTYYGSLTNGGTGCASAVRLAVTVTVNDGATPTTTDTTQDFCLINNPTVANLSTVESGVTWYATATGGTAIPAATALVNGTYYGSLTNGVTGCASSVRLAVTVTVNYGATPTTTDTTQDFCLVNNPTVANLSTVETGVTWYATATGGTAIPAATALADGIYYGSLTNGVTGCASSVRLAVTVDVNDQATPTTTDTTQDFCLINNPTVASLSTVETGVTWYATATGGTAIPAATALANGTYYGSLTNGGTGCASAVRLAVTVTVYDGPTPTTTDTTQDFCLINNPTVANLVVNETGVTWYATATGGTAIPAATALADGIYYGSLTDGVTGCASSVRLAVTVDVDDAPTPTTTDTTQDFCLINNPTVANLSTVETGVTWYTAATGGTVIPAATALTNAVYYGSLTDGVTGCASSVRLAVTVTVGNAATPTTADASQDFCLLDAPTVGDIDVNESNVAWYTAATGGTLIPNGTALTSGTYYGSQTVAGCQSATRLVVTVTVGNAATPTTTDSTQDFCQVNNPTIADIDVTETGVVWYTAAIGGTIVPAATALTSGTYYASLTDGVTGCTSAVRLAVTVTVDDAPTPTTGDTTQDFCQVTNPTVADIQVNQTGVVWYNAATGGTIVTNATALTSGVYYGSLTDGVTGCISATRLMVTVTVNDAATPTTTDTTQEFCSYANPTIASLQVNEAGVNWFAAATGGTALSAATLLVNNTTYYASITTGGCASSQRLAVTVTLTATCDVTMNLKVMLQGALFNSVGGLMRDDLRVQNQIPLNQPYSSALSTRFAHVNGGGSEMTNSTVLGANAGTGDAIVDWVFVEVRSQSAPGTVIKTAAALLQRDGDVVAADGGPLVVGGLPQTFFVIIKHRNHLGAMEANALTVVNGAVTLDFTNLSGSALYSLAGYSSGASMATVNGVRALFAANASFDNKTKYDGVNNDRQVIGAQVLANPGNTGQVLNFSNATGYYSGDVNMDGKALYDGVNNDRQIMLSIIINYPLNTSDLNNYNDMIEQIPQ